jgi:hypothetical protein
MNSEMVENDPFEVAVFMFEKLLANGIPRVKIEEGLRMAGVPENILKRAWYAAVVQDL